MNASPDESSSKTRGASDHGSKPQQGNPSKSGWSMLSGVSVLYVVAALADPSKARVALSTSLSVLETVAPIVLIVVALMASLNSFIKPPAITKHLGKDSGMRGWMIALLGGLLSHGSGYVWYPMLSQLRERGAKDGLVVTFFYARAIKIPWLPMMVSYFGLTFTVLLTLYILLGALAQGLLADALSSADVRSGEERKRLTCTLLL